MTESDITSARGDSRETALVRPRPEGGLTGRQIRILIAVHHAATRVGLRRALPERGFQVCAEATSAAEAVSAADQHDPDVCLLDIDMPGGGIEAAREVCERRPSTTIVMLADGTRDADFFDALHAGASGYLVKDMDPARLAAALTDAHAGAAAVPRRLVTQLIDALREPPAGRRIRLPNGADTHLTRREAEVLELLAAGATTSAIAVRLSLSPVTVRRHVSAIVAKLGVRDRATAVRLVRDLGV